MNKKLLALLLSLMLWTTLHGEIFTPTDWSRVDTVMSSMTRDRYQLGELVVKKSFKRLYFTTIKTEQEYAWLFDTNVHRAFVGSSRNGSFWVMRDVEFLREQSPRLSELIRGQLDSIENVVKTVNEKESK